ncbi:hypothetical protein BDB00DRAFT_810615 [Zychaea mexicana]|uniref:uncharacterized protein n=1 Tax=Zychaea mexicana TaxID=64656 RepID=UPI0022FE91FA|nr:uncharacterized protein BDB00DRAFT_810615 [Zychaea mexicana]KAI9496134.1 hypothetical protein BDB00DRAFT_810615 [Zychaea mexicana]
MSLKWGIIGTGSIAHTFATGLKAAKRGELVAIGSRAKESAVKFGAQYGVPDDKCYATYAELFNDPSVDIVYISTPHPQHCEVSIQAAQSKKNILVEKPFAMNEAEATRILAAAKENDVFLMEAYMYRCHPQTCKIVELVHNGSIGDVKMIKANFAFDGRPLGASSRLWRNELGGGAIMDIGGYPMSFARLIAGAATNSGFANPTEIKAVGHVQADTQVDEWTTASLAFGEKISAQLFTAIFADLDSCIEVLGSKGSIKAPNLWRPDLPAMAPMKIELTEYGKEPQVVAFDLPEPDLYAIEADAVADAVFQGAKECKYMTWEDSMGQIRAIDKWRKEIGLIYSADK